MPAFLALRFFAFERLLERGQFGERRIGIRRLVAIARACAMRLGIILFALGALDLIAKVAVEFSQCFRGIGGIFRRQAGRNGRRADPAC